MIIDLEKVEGDLRIVHNLSQYYSYDISEISEAEYYRCRDTGLFAGGCEKYKSEHCDINLIRVDDELAGFTIAGPHSTDRRISKDDSIFTVWEFFVLRRFRNRGVGTTVAHRLFDAHGDPGMSPFGLPMQQLFYFGRGPFRRIQGISTSVLLRTMSRAMMKKWSYFVFRMTPARST